MSQREILDRALSGDEFRSLVERLDEEPEMVRRLVATVVHVKQTYAKRLADALRASLMESGRNN